MKGYEMTNYTVEISDSALMHLCVAGIESYRLPKRPRETYGLLWGSVSSEKKEEIYYQVAHVFTDIEAKRRANSVTYSEESIYLKRETIGKCWPTQTFLGDFHTHPYRNSNDAAGKKGYVASDGDRKDVERNNRDLWLAVKSRISLVLTIAELDRRGSAKPKRFKNNEHIVRWAIRWTTDNYYQFWLAAYVVDKIERPRKRTKLFLNPREEDWIDDWKDKIDLPEHQVWLDIPSVLGNSNFTLDWSPQ